MSMPKEHDYIGLSETPSMERISDKLSSSSSSSSTLSSDDTNKNNSSNNNNTPASLNLKETELRLGLPGSHSPERKPVPVAAVSLFGKDIETNGYSLSNPLKNLVSGAKRGFSDAIDASSGKWVFNINNGSDADLGKGAVLFSPRGADNGTAAQKSSVSVSPKKEVAATESVQEKNNNQVSSANENNSAPAAKAQVVGWPPIRSFRKNSMSATVSKNNEDAESRPGWPPIRSFQKNSIASNVAKNTEDAEGKSGYGCLYIKVSMDGAPYLRKVDLKTYSNYKELSSALEKMFSCFTIGQCGSHGLSESHLKDLLHGSEYVLTYEDKDGDWMLVGDVPWEMFTDSCRRLRIMKGSEAIGLAPRAMEKCKNRN